MIAGMSKLAKSEQSPESCWRTPIWLRDRLRQTVLGSMFLDPCTDTGNPMLAAHFYTPADDGILQPWFLPLTYINPPYGRTISKWVEKSICVARVGGKAVMLVPARTDSKWFQSLLTECDDMLLIAGRLYFTQPDGSGERAPFPSAMFGLNISLEPLSDLGTLVQVKR